MNKPVISPVISIDFDGVLHSYLSGWCGEAVIPDPPVSGAVCWVEELVEAGLRIVVSSARAKSPKGVAAIKEWLRENEFPVESMEITNIKVPALMYVDDRAYRFDGKHFPSAHTVKTGAPWMQKGCF